ncbi:hypothetical protein Ptr902_06761 [Pyrenophora tritici-repentis]|nr:hypothetical protein Ptr902_06761 [Pyrenophora tritici-repentis]
MTTVPLRNLKSLSTTCTRTPIMFLPCLHRIELAGYNVRANQLFFYSYPYSDLGTKLATLELSCSNIHPKAIEKNLVRPEFQAVKKLRIRNIGFSHDWLNYDLNLLTPIITNNLRNLEVLELSIPARHIMVIRKLGRLKGLTKLRELKLDVNLLTGLNDSGCEDRMMHLLHPDEYLSDILQTLIIDGIE